ncbi:hypothetical protein RHABOEDO_001702 [Candidatus Rhabdochlamydia oedothoracis]|uniref:Transposase n=1 Tax=Candidatus Rhabdochlamydia oedothoracis TaxID=2720720 RepID=A0ABX8V8L2_9BACT|nr:hypothetical protein RHABOEDO_001702 [Candidatus Rhabdochlamydia oedothoracis]
MSRAMEKLRKKTTYKPEYGSSRFYCSTFEKILNRLLEEIPKITDVLKCRINDKFQVVDLKPIKLAV